MSAVRHSGGQTPDQASSSNPGGAGDHERKSRTTAQEPVIPVGHTRSHQPTAPHHQAANAVSAALVAVASLDDAHDLGLHVPRHPTPGTLARCRPLLPALAEIEQPLIFTPPRAGASIPSSMAADPAKVKMAM